MDNWNEAKDRDNDTANAQIEYKLVTTIDASSSQVKKLFHEKFC
jgi:hypothetical protein